MFKSYSFIPVIALIFSFSASICEARVSVSGYYRKNGTYVAPHFRSSPDGIVSNNWSYRGNVNPYTGEIGHNNGDRHYYSAPIIVQPLPPRNVYTQPPQFEIKIEPRFLPPTAPPKNFSVTPPQYIPAPVAPSIIEVSPQKQIPILSEYYLKKYKTLIRTLRTKNKSDQFIYSLVDKFEFGDRIQAEQEICNAGATSFPFCKKYEPAVIPQRELLVELE